MEDEAKNDKNAARLLLVEDEKIIALDLQRRLEKYGYEVVGLCNDGTQAIATTNEKLPDLVLMDIMLSGETDGITAAVEIFSTHQIPIVFLTAYADQRTLERAKEAQPFGYVLKPFKERELFSTIDIALYKSGVDKTLKRHERWLNAVLRNIGDGIIATNSKGEVDFINPAAEKITGWNKKDNQELLARIFPLHDAQTMLPVPIPAADSLSVDTPMFFENLLLLNKAGAHIHIEGSFAGIYDENLKCEGLVVAFQDVTAIKTMSDTIVYQASHDSLTGLINRDEFFTCLKNSINQNSRTKPDFLLYLDVDQFKIVNDLCGHLAGDELLRTVANEIRTILPKSSSFARLGGDEFGILLQELDKDAVMEIAQQLTRLVERKFTWKEHSVNTSVSIGIVAVDGKMDPYSVLAAADDATYLAKEAGGNTAKLYQTADFSFLKRRGEMQWVSRLTDALEHNRFVLFEQPIVLLSDGSLAKHEILLRLQDDDAEEKELISPLVFIPAAERYNLMPAIDRWVVKNTFEFIAQSSSPRKYCINLSGASIADPTLTQFMHSQFSEYGINPEKICFEITETTAIENLSRAIEFIAAMRDKGASFALDDFGSGFSSFTYLKNLPVQFLKLDGSYVKDILTDAVSMQMVESINDIGHVLGMKTIAEFVRSSELITSLNKIGVDMGQGFEIQKPAPLADSLNK
ncbi:MAG: GGDEF domain-containing response regulator [Spirochaetaceae bacterium]|nr:MAG: GGDEF domain-containing response regulator [Spirochaetaceae bacterium]